MTVFLAHAPVDRQTAVALEKVIERRGQFAELDDGHTAMKPIGSGDVLVLLVSSALTFATARLRLEQRALDAWAQGRLVVVKLDHGIPPVGLRDLPAIDATFEAAREFKWNEVADAVRRVLDPPMFARGDVDDEDRPEWDQEADRLEEYERASRREAQAEVRSAREAGRRRLLKFIGAVALMLPGLLAIAATASIWLVNRIGPTPGGWSELVRGIEAFGARYGLPAGVTPWLFAAAAALLFAVLVVVTVHAFARPKAAPELRRKPPRPRIARAKPPTSDAVFVSYARANDMAVLPLIEAAKRAGRKFWLDQQGISAGDGWAGEIVRAIKAAGGVVVMCSKAAFESDHVKREIYLADRYRKRLVPVFIEQAEPPEDFEYFFAGVQSLNLFETPEEERPEALIRVLGAAA